MGENHIREEGEREQSHQPSALTLKNGDNIIQRLHQDNEKREFMKKATSFICRLG